MHIYAAIKRLSIKGITNDEKRVRKGFIDTQRNSRRAFMNNVGLFDYKTIGEANRTLNVSSSGS